MRIIFVYNSQCAWTTLNKVLNKTSLILLLLKGVSSKSNMKWQKFSYGFIHFVRTHARKIFRKTNISYPLIRTLMRAYQGVRSVAFLENFARVLNGWPLFHLFCRPKQ